MVSIEITQSKTDLYNFENRKTDIRLLHIASRNSNPSFAAENFRIEEARFLNDRALFLIVTRSKAIGRGRLSRRIELLSIGAARNSGETGSSLSNREFPNDLIQMGLLSQFHEEGREERGRGRSGR